MTVNKSPFEPNGRKIGSTKVAGSCQLATNAQVTTGTKTDRVITPYQLATYGATVTAATDVQAQAKVATDKTITPANLAAEGFIQYADATLTSAQVKALAATQIELVPAQGAGAAILFMGAMLKLDYGSNVFTESGDNLGIKYTDASGVQVSSTIEMTGFIDATADTICQAVPVTDAIVAAASAENKALVLDNLGSEIAGNAAADSTVSIRTFYQVVSL